MLLPAASALEIQGHRGSRGTSPENSLISFDHAFESGASTIELDVVATRDGHLVVHHDQSISSKYCKTPLSHLADRSKVPLRELSLKEVLSYRCVSKLGLDDSVWVKIPTFVEALLHIDRLSPDIKVNVESKLNIVARLNPLEPREFVQEILDAMDRAGFERSRTMHQAFSWKVLDAYHELAPELETAVLTFGHFNVQKLVKRFQGQLDYITTTMAGLTEERIDEAKAEGLKVLVWTVNEREDWESLMKMQVDGIITDHPEELVELFEARN